MYTDTVGNLLQMYANVWQLPYRILSRTQHCCDKQLLLSELFNYIFFLKDKLK